MGTKILIIAAMLYAIASSGHAFAFEPTSRDGLTKSIEIIVVRKAKAIHLALPKTRMPNQG